MAVPQAVRGAVTFAVPLLLGCLGNPTEAEVCTTEARAGITVEVVDIVTDQSLADGAVLTLREGEYVETVDQSPDGRHLSGAYERAGVYEVRVDKEGYIPWRSPSVDVLSGRCHVEGVELRAFLVDLGGL